MTTRLLLSLLLCSWIPVSFVSCSGGKDSGYNPDIGPFDEDGNYIEAWADNPPKRGSRKRIRNAKPESRPKTKVKAKPRRKPAPKQKAKSAPSRPKAKPVTKPKPKPRPKPKAKPRSKPKPKPIKVKPKTVRHVVKKGDTLYSISRKYGSSVSKIQKANGLKGTNIRDGSTLVIPR